MNYARGFLAHYGAPAKNGKKEGRERGFLPPAPRPFPGAMPLLESQYSSYRGSESLISCIKPHLLIPPLFIPSEAKERPRLPLFPGYSGIPPAFSLFPPRFLEKAPRKNAHSMQTCDGILGRPTCETKSVRIQSPNSSRVNTKQYFEFFSKVIFIRFSMVGGRTFVFVLKGL